MQEVNLKIADNGVIKTITDDNINAAGENYESTVVYDFEKGIEDRINFINDICIDIGLDFGNSKQLCDDSESKFKEGDKITITAEIKRHTKDQRDFVFDDGFDQVMKPLTVLSKPKLIK